MIQTQIFYQTALKEISVTKAGTVRNNKTGKLLTVGERGYFILNQKPHNLPKLQLQTFQKIPIKSGRINFIDGDKNNYHFENIICFETTTNSATYRHRFKSRFRMLFQVK